MPTFANNSVKCYIWYKIATVMKKLIVICAALVALTGCFSQRKATEFPKMDNNGQVGIAAHRGFWKCEQAVNSQNSIASLTLAQDNGFWGSECDIHLTADGEIIVNHDHDIEGLVIAEHSYAELSSHLLANGEKRPTFDEYLDQAAKAPKTVLVVELKPQGSDERDEALVRKVMDKIRKHGLWDPSKVAFISFSYFSCKKVAELAPAFVNQYLEGDIAPGELAKAGINGIDYNYKVLYEHPEWVKQAHDLGMSVNVWTVNTAKDMRNFIEMGVDVITTNEPLMLREILGEKEYKN